MGLPMPTFWCPPFNLGREALFEGVAEGRRKTGGGGKGGGKISAHKTTNGYLGEISGGIADADFLVPPIQSRSRSPL